MDKKDLDGPRWTKKISNDMFIYFVCVLQALLSS